MPEYVAPGAAYTSRVVRLATGLAGTIRFRLVDDDATVDDPVYGPSTANIVEDPTGSGSYLFRGTAPTTQGKYVRLWDTGAATALIPDDDLYVSYTAPAASVPSGSDYITLAEFKATANLTGETYADADIGIAVTAASRGLDTALGQRFWLDADVNQLRYYTAEEDISVIRIDPLVTLTWLKTDPDGDGDFDYTWVEGTDFVLEPRNATADARPWNQIRRLTAATYSWPDSSYPHSIELKGKFGWPAAPAAVKQLTTLIAKRLVMRTRQAPFGIVQLGPEGAAVRATAFARDPEYQFLIQGLSRRRLFV